MSDSKGPGGQQCRPARIAYVKLEPLSHEEVAALGRDRERKDTKRLFAHNDAHGTHNYYRPSNEEELRRHIEAYGDSDFGRMYWEAGGGDKLNYFTSVGRIKSTDGIDDFPLPGYRHQTESWKIFSYRNVDPFRVALDYCREIGVEFHAGYRVAGFHYPPPYDHFNHGDSFYKRHPELRGVDRAGNATPRISYAYPETREFVVSILREVAAYGVDGIALLYNRRPPLLDYEPPLVEGFQAEFGEDPRALPEDDSRWLAYRARVMTQFMREVRDAMRAVEGDLGMDRPIHISAVVAATLGENLQYALDIEKWIAEGLVDTIAPYSSLPSFDSLNEAWSEMADVDRWVAVTNGTNTKLALNIMPRQFSAEDYMRKANALYKRGVDNLFFWDADVRRAKFRPSWNALRRLGHREEVAEWVKRGEPDLTPPHQRITRLGDWDMRYVTAG